MMKKILIAGGVVLAGLAAVYAAKRDGATDAAAPVEQARPAEAEAAIRAALAKGFGGAAPKSIRATPMPGLYEVTVGREVVYMTQDGRFLLAGDLYDTQRGVNLTEELRNIDRKAALAGMDEATLVVFGPKNAKHTVTVFTDIDCGYCRKLHQEMAQINGLGIRVRYALYPRAGVGSESYRKAVAVWCAKDRQQALTVAKRGEPIEMKTCTNPVDRHLASGDAMGVRGTPTIVLGNGEVIPGYQPAAQLLASIEGSLKP